MATQMYRLEIQVRANDAGAVLAKIEQRLHGVEKSSDGAGVALNGFAKGANHNTKQVSENLHKLGQRMHETTSHANKLQGAFSSITPTMQNLITQMTALYSASALIGKMDAYTGLQNRLKLVVKDVKELNFALENTFKIAQNTGSDWDSAVLVFQKFSENAKKLNLTLEQTVSLTETVSKAVSISGSSAEAAQAALMQFGQALGSGVLRGDEFNSVNEQAGGILKALAFGLGVTTAELRTMANEGKLTTDVLRDGLTKAKPYIDEMFAKKDFTVAQSFQMLSNSMTKFVGEAGQASGAAKALSETIQFAANNFSWLMDGALVLGIGYITKAIVAKTQAIGASIMTAHAQRAATIQNTQAELAQANAKVASTQAELARVKSSYQAIVALKGEAVAQAQLTTATNAATAATTAQANAQKAATAVALTFGNALKGVMAFLGGPVGLALTVASVAGSYLLLNRNASETTPILDTQTKTVSELVEEYKKLSTAQKQLARDQITDEIDDQTKVYDKQRQALEVLTARIMNNSDANQQEKAAIYEVLQQYRDKQISAEELSVKIRDMGVASDDFARQLTKQAVETDNAATKLDEKRAIAQGYENAAYNAANASGSLSGQLSGVANSAGVAAGQMANLTAEAKKYLATISQTAFNDGMTLRLMQKGYSQSVARGLTEAYTKNGNKITPEIAKQVLEADKAKQALNNYIKATTPKVSGGRRTSGGGRKTSGRSKAMNDAKRAQERLNDAIENTKANWEKMRYEMSKPLKLEIDKLELDLLQGSLKGVGKEKAELLKKQAHMVDQDVLKHELENSVYENGLRIAGLKHQTDFDRLFAQMQDERNRLSAFVGDGKVELWANDELLSANSEKVHYLQQIALQDIKEFAIENEKILNNLGKQAELLQAQSDFARKKLEIEHEYQDTLDKYESMKSLPDKSIYEQAVAQAKMTKERKLGFIAQEATKAVESELVNLEKERFAIGKSSLEILLYEIKVMKKFEGASQKVVDNYLKQYELNIKDKAIYQAKLKLEEQRFLQANHANKQAALEWSLIQQGLDEVTRKTILTIDKQTKAITAYAELQERFRASVATPITANDVQGAVLGTATALQGLENDRNIIKQRHQVEMDLLKEQLEAKKILQQEYDEKERQLKEQHTQDMVNLTLLGGGTVLSGLSSIAKNALGEQSSTYRVMFETARAFYLAQAGMNVFKAGSDAWANTQGTTWQKAAAAATAVAESSSFIPLIQNITARGFKTGGYTGNYSTNQVAGVVHGQEYVMNAKATKRIGVNNLERLSNGEGIGGVKVIINNYSNETATAEQMPNGDIMVTIGKVAKYIARDEIQKYHNSQLRQGGIYYGR